MIFLLIALYFVMIAVGVVIRLPLVDALLWPRTLYRVAWAWTIVIGED